MCDQTMPYELGTMVWFKAADRVWWPARIVDSNQTPEEFQFFMESRKNVLGVVFFEREKFYDLIINMNKVCLYSSPNKMDFVKKGHDLYLKQCAGKKTYFDMSKFMDDVLQFEKEIGGDLNIFNKIPVKEKVPQEVKNKIKELFPSSYNTKTKKSSNKIQNSKLKNITNTLKLSNTSLSSLPKKVLLKTVSPKVEKPIPSIANNTKFMCALINGCNFKTNNYNSLKRHFAEHNINKGNDDTSKATIKSLHKKSASKKNTSNKATLTTNLNIKRSDAKKIKLQDELSKDWSDIDQDKVVGAHLLVTSSTAIEKNENTIFDFDENSNETDENVSDPQRNKLSESFHDCLTLEVMDLELCATKNDENNNDILKQSFNLEHHINDRIDDNIECATLLLENAEDNLDKVNHLEDSFNTLNYTKENVIDMSLIPHDSNNLEVQELNGNIDELSLTDEMYYESVECNSNLNTEHIQEEIEVKSTVYGYQYDCLIDCLPIPNWVKELIKRLYQC